MSYYDYFDNESNGGRVFDADLSVVTDLPVNHLTLVEKTERETWRNKMMGIYNHYENVDPPLVTTTELLLQQRVMVPNLGTLSVSSRSQFNEARQGRRYPATISEWHGFLEEVKAFRPNHKNLKPNRSDIFTFSMLDTSPHISLSDEKEEEGYLLLILKKSLMTAGLLGEISSRGGLGKPDALTLKADTIEIPGPSDIGLIVEFRSTHNLPLPMTSMALVAAYNKAYQDVVVDRIGRTAEWSRICHPIGQILGYMVENGRRYGVLSSATRSYFTSIEGDGPNAIIRISNPIFVGEPNFLRAWAYVHDSACQQATPLRANSLDWKLLTSKENLTPPVKGSRRGLRSIDSISEGSEIKQDNADGDCEMSSASAYEGIACSLLETPIDNVEIVRTLGYGRNGVVFLAKWEGQHVALKQFDVGKDGYENFDKEVEAYETLRSAWGSLVPKPLFVSESWSGWTKFIGLQLGRDPQSGDDVSERSNVLAALENDYGFRHEDATGGNMVFISDEETGAERLVAIDLESFTRISGD